MTLKQVRETSREVESVVVIRTITAGKYDLVTLMVVEINQVYIQQSGQTIRAMRVTFIVCDMLELNMTQHSFGSLTNT